MQKMKLVKNCSNDTCNICGSRRSIIVLKYGRETEHDSHFTCMPICEHCAEQLELALNAYRTSQEETIINDIDKDIPIATDATTASETTSDNLSEISFEPKTEKDRKYILFPWSDTDTEIDAKLNKALTMLANGEIDEIKVRYIDEIDALRDMYPELYDTFDYNGRADDWWGNFHFDGHNISVDGNIPGRWVDLVLDDCEEATKPEPVRLSPADTQDYLNTIDEIDLSALNNTDEIDHAIETKVAEWKKTHGYVGVDIKLDDVVLDEHLQKTVNKF